MLRVETAIQRVHRGNAVASALKVAFFLAIVGCLLIGPTFPKLLALGAVLFAWIWLSFTSARGSQIVADSPSLIASGQYEEAEQRIDQAIASFSLFRIVKLQALHNLALLRHAQQRWQETAILCRALLRQRLGPNRSLSRQSHLILADALLEMSDLPGAYQAMINLYRQRLPLSEVLSLLLVQLDYESRVGAWQEMMRAIEMKVQLAELMPTQQSARAQALLALAAMKMGRQDWADWLRQRAQLLAEPQRICADRPNLGELWNISQAD